MMSKPQSPPQVQQLNRVLYQSQALEQKNKQAAKEQLLAIQLLLARYPRPR